MAAINRHPTTDREDRSAPDHTAIADDRPLRSDARRNRARLVDAARAAFAATDGPVPLDAVARDAGVGIGTLYRHFPTREALVEAVYAADLDEVTGSVAALLDEMPPEAALRAWMDRYARHAATKHAMIGTLPVGWAPSRTMSTTARARINEAVAAFLAAGVRTGSLRDDVDPDDVTTMMVGACLTTGSPAQTGRLLDLVVHALRPPGVHVRRPTRHDGR